MSTSGCVARVCSGAISLPSRFLSNLRMRATLNLENMPASVQDAQLVHGPVAEDGLAIDIAAHHRADLAAVIRHGTMVAKHKIRIVGDNGLRKRTGVQVIRRNVRLGQQHAVHVNMSVSDKNAVAGQADHALNEALARVAGIMEDNDVTARDAFKAVDQLVDEDPLLVFQSGLHAAAFHLDRLIDKQNDEKSNENGEEQVAHPRTQGAQAGGL